MTTLLRRIEDVGHPGFIERSIHVRGAANSLRIKHVAQSTARDKKENNEEQGSNSAA